MPRIAFILIWSYLTVLKVTATDTYLNFTTGVNLGDDIKQAFSHYINRTQYVFILYSNTSIVRYDSQFNFTGLVHQSLGGRNLSNLNIITGSDGFYYHGIVEGGSEFFVFRQDNYNINFSLLENNLKHVSVLFIKSSGSISMMVYRDDVAIFRNLSSLFATHNFSRNTASRNYVTKVIRVFHGTRRQSDVVFTSLKQVYLYDLVCDSSGGCYIDSNNKIKDLSAVSSLQINGYFLDKQRIISIQYSDGKIFSFYFNGSNVPINIQTVQTNTGSSLIKNIVSQNISGSVESVFVYADKSIRVSLQYSTNLKSNLINSTYNYRNDSQTSFPLTNWTGLAEFSQSQGFVYTKNSPIIFGYCYTRTTGSLLTECRPMISCPLANCYICNRDYNECATCMPSFLLYQSVCYPIKTCQVSNCQICTFNETCLKCFTNYTLDKALNTCNAPGLTTVTSSNTTANSTNNTNSTDANTNSTDANTNSTNANTNSTNTNTNSTNTTIVNDHSVIDAPTINTTNNTTDRNQTIGFEPISTPLGLNSSNETNSSQPIILINTTTITNVNQSQQQTSYYLNISQTAELITKIQDGFTPSVQKLSTMSSSMNSLPGSRQIFGFLTPIFFFFDDFWYYIYHEDNYLQLQYMPSFLVFMYSINQQKILPQFLNFGIPFNISSFIRSNYTSYTHRQIYSIENNQTYFAQNIQFLVLHQYILIFLGVIFIKVIILIIEFFLSKQFQCQTNNLPQKDEKRCTQFPHQLKRPEQQTKIHQQNTNNKPFNILSGLKTWLANFVNLKSVLLMLFSSNLIFLSFTFGTQMRLLISFNSFDTANLTLTILLGFVLITFVLLIFLHSQLFCKKKLVSTKSNEIWDSQNNKKEKVAYLNGAKRDDLYLTYLIHIKTILYGFVHGFFISYPSLQYVLLILIKIYLLYILVNKKHITKSFSLSVCLFLYYTAGICIDFLCYFSKNEMIPKQLRRPVVFDYSWVKIIESVCLLIVCLSVICQIFLEIYLGIRDFFFPNRRIAGQLQTQNSRSIFMFLRRTQPQNRNFKSQETLKNEASINASQKNFELKKSSAKMIQIVDCFSNSDHQKDFIYEKPIIKKIRTQNKLNNTVRSRIQFKKKKSLSTQFDGTDLQKDRKIIRNAITTESIIKMNYKNLQNNEFRQDLKGTTPATTRKVQFNESKMKDAREINENAKKIAEEQFKQVNIQKFQGQNLMQRYKRVRQKKIKQETSKELSMVVEKRNSRKKVSTKSSHLLNL